MYIGFYCEPINRNLVNYKGIYRQNNIVELMESKNCELMTAIDWFFLISKEGIFVEYSEKNNGRLFNLYSMLKEQKWKGELILFTDNCSVIVPYEFELLGYDICADSKYYSPLGDEFLQSYDKRNPFFAEMSIFEFEYYKNNLNNAGLFNSYSTALEFSKYCNEINEKYNHALESEKNWRPFVIYRKCKSCIDNPVCK